MLALVAAVIFLLLGVDVIHNTGDVNWVFVAAAFWAAHFGLNLGFPVRFWDRDRT